MVKRHFVIVGIVCILISLCLSCSNNRLVNTEWKSEAGTVISFGKTSFTYEGVTANNHWTGVYTISGDTVTMNFGSGDVGIGSLIGGNLMVSGANVAQQTFQRVR
jgi:hypothetical protein